MENYLAALLLHAAPLLCVFVAAFLQAITGFGLVIVAAPLLMFFYDPKVVILVMILLATCGNITQTVFLHRYIRWDIIKWLIVGAIVVQPISFLVFATIPSLYLKLLISMMVLFSLTIMQLRHSRITERPRNTFIVGLLAGILATTTGMSGPPLVIYFAYTTLTIQELRATCIGFFLLSGLVSLTTFIIGSVDMSVPLDEFVYLLPGLAAGIAIGQATFRYFPVHVLKKLIFALLYVTCFYTIYSVFA